MKQTNLFGKEFGPDYENQKCGYVRWHAPAGYQTLRDRI